VNRASLEKMFELPQEELARRYNRNELAEAFGSLRDTVEELRVLERLFSVQSELAAGADPVTFDEHLLSFYRQSQGVGDHPGDPLEKATRGLLVFFRATEEGPTKVGVRPINLTIAEVLVALRVADNALTPVAFHDIQEIGISP